MSGGDSTTPYGPPPPPVRQRLSPFIFIQEWQWARPFQAILQFSAHSIDAIVDDPRAAAEVSTLWKVWKAAEGRRAERERLVRVVDVLWWRAMGCPVPCIVCGKLEPCHCGKKEPFASSLLEIRRRGVGKPHGGWTIA